MPGVYLDFQERYDSDYWKIFEGLEYHQIELVESHARGYIRLFFPEAIEYNLVLDAIAAITFQQCGRWYFDHEGHTYRKLLPREKYAQLYQTVNKRLQRMEHKCRKIIRGELEMIIAEKNCFNVSGYLQFYAGKLKRLLYKLTQEEYCRLEEEIEQEEFTELLRLFISVQEPVIEVAYLIIKDLDHFQLLDRWGNDLAEEYLASVKVEDITDISSKDLIMSVLVTLIPKKIVIEVKNEVPQDFLHLLESVFADRLEYYPKQPPME